MSARRSAALAVIIGVVGALAWFTWPRPDLWIRVAPGGEARVINRHGDEPLRDTLQIRAQGPVKIRVENRDSVTHRLGIFGVSAKTTSEYTIAQPGVYSVYCSTHPGRRLTYVVR